MLSQEDVNYKKPQRPLEMIGHKDQSSLQSCLLPGELGDSDLDAESPLGQRRLLTSRIPGPSRGLVELSRRNDSFGEEWNYRRLCEAINIWFETAETVEIKVK